MLLLLWRNFQYSIKTFISPWNQFFFFFFISVLSIAKYSEWLTVLVFPQKFKRDVSKENLLVYINNVVTSNGYLYLNRVTLSNCQRVENWKHTIKSQLRPRPKLNKTKLVLQGVLFCQTSKKGINKAIHSPSHLKNLSF